MAESAKLDPGLMLALHDYERQSRKSEPDKAISVILEFRGELAPLAAFGFAPATVMGSEAVGTVRFADLARLAAHPDVLRISAGQRRRLRLDTSVRDIHARAPTVADIGTKGLWHADVATGTLTSTGGATGKGVIIAMIDSGIDVSHPMFNKAISPKYESRIIRIWDQGVRPAAGEAGPPANLLLSPVTYGVEYKTKDINDALEDSLFPLLPLDFPHRDCEGHGTHVASIAAGGPTFAPSTDAARVGVAPEADIIMVKVFDTPDEIRDANNNVVSNDVRVRDAVIYCLRTAKSLNQPIVISCSFGNMVEAGDGLDAESRWFHQTFDPARAADDNHFPKGAILVKAAGNEGDVTYRNFARITVPDSREIVVPFELYDTRGPDRSHVENCFRKANVPALRVTLWYREVPAPQDVSIAARVPTETTFSSEVFASFLSKDFDGGKTRIISHDALPPVQRPDGAGGTVAVRRNSAQLVLRPTPRTSPPQHALGIYDIRIRAPAGTVVFAACDQGAGFGFQVATAYRDASLLPAPEIIAGSAAPITPIDVTAEGTIDTDMITPHIITVAAYDDANGLTANANYKALSAFSSRGPIRDYSNPPLGRLTDKPDIAAPGVLISAALSKDTDINLARFADYAFMQGNRFDAYSGTSMAAPAIAGVVALMLQKKNDLSVSDVRDTLTALANVNPGLHPAVGDPGYSEGFGAGLVDALKSHAAIT